MSESSNVPDSQEIVIEDVPSLKDLTAIEMPCFTSTDKAMTLMGNRELVYHCILRESPEIQLHFRPDDPISHPIVGKRQESSALLVKVRRKRQSPTSQPQVEVMGKITSSYRFRSLADFQFLPSSLHTNGERPVDNNQETLETPPPVFCRTSTPANLFNPNKNMNVIAKERRRDRIIIIQIHDPIPERPPVDQTHRRALKKFLATQEALQKLFEIRPIWQLRIIETAPMFENKKNMMHECLHFFAFKYSAGPWAKSCCRYNYNPTRHRDASIYQSIYVRFKQQLLADWSKEIYEAAAENVHTTTMGVIRVQANLDTQQIVISTDAFRYRDSDSSTCKLILFGCKLKQQVSYQLCDIDDEAVLEYVHQQELQEQCHEKKGWFSETMNDDIRNIIVNAAQQRVQRLLTQLRINPSDVIAIDPQEQENKATSDGQVWLDDIMQLPKKYAATIGGGGFDVAGGDASTEVDLPLITVDEPPPPKLRTTNKKQWPPCPPKRQRTSQPTTESSTASSETEVRVAPTIVTTVTAAMEQPMVSSPRMPQLLPLDTAQPFEVFDNNDSASDSAYSEEASSDDDF